jgi:hypothetical protein
MTMLLMPHFYPLCVGDPPRRGLHLMREYT